MTALKAHEVDAFVRKPDPMQRFILVYGPDYGLVSERATALVKAHLKGNTDPFALVRLEGDQIASDPGRLADEMNTVALFGGERVVWVRAGAKSFVPSLEAVFGSTGGSSALVVEAGDLKGGAPLRKAFESARDAVALPCFPDEERDVVRLIDEEMSAAGLAIGPEARDMLRATLGGDRMASRQELRKLALYCHGKTRVEEDDVRAISDDVGAIAMDAAIDAMGLGEMPAVASAYRRLVDEGTNASVIAGAALRHLQQLQVARAEVDRGRAVGDAVRELIPPVFYKRQPAFQRQLVLWTVAKAERGASMLQQAVLDSRRYPAISQSVVERALLATAGLARRRV